MPATPTSRQSRGGASRARRRAAVAAQISQFDAIGLEEVGEYRRLLAHGNRKAPLRRAHTAGFSGFCGLTLDSLRSRRAHGRVAPTHGWSLVHAARRCALGLP
jgi:hypothetical protein